MNRLSASTNEWKGNKSVETIELTAGKFITIGKTMIGKHLSTYFIILPCGDEFIFTPSAPI